MSSRPRALRTAGCTWSHQKDQNASHSLRDVGEGEAGALQEAVPDMDVVGRPAHRQRIEAAPAGLAVEQGGHVDGVGIEQVQDRAEGVLEVDEPVVVSPAGGRRYIDGCPLNRKSGGAPACDAASRLCSMISSAWLDELDLLAGLLLERGDDLADRLVLLGVKPFSHQTTRSAALGAERRIGRAAAARTTGDQPLHGSSLRRICLIRAIASSTACSGLMPSATTRWTALPQTCSCQTRS